MRSRLPLSLGAGVALLLTACEPAPDQASPGSRSFHRALALEDSGFTSANVSLGDLNGDSHLDVVLVKGRHWPLEDRVLLGDGSGGFAPAYSVNPTADRSYSGLLLDLDGDGDLDLVVSNDRPDAKVVHLNDGTGQFTLASSFGEPEWSTRHINTADVNRDGIPDVVLANRSGGNDGLSYLCMGQADGSFGDDCVGFAQGSATTITPADFNGDGAPDLAVPHRDIGQSYIYLNDGSGGFDERRPFGPPDVAIRSSKAADFNDDGFLDMVVIDERTGPALLVGESDLAFGDPIPLGDSEARPYALQVADLDQDGRTDIIVGYVESRPIAYFNDGPGTFTAVRFGDDEGVAYGFDVGDVDEDGFLDIAMARSNARNMLYFGSAAPSPDTQSAADIEEELIALNRRLFETQILDQDPSFLLSITDDSYTIIAPGGVVEDRDQVIAGLRAFATIDSLALQNERVIRSGSTAVVMSRLVLFGEIQVPMGNVPPTSTMTVFHQGDDGAWKAVSRALSACNPRALERGIC